MSNRETVNIVYFFNSNTKIAIKDCYFWRACHELDEGIHLILIELLDYTPEPFYYWWLFRIALIFYFAYQGFYYIGKIVPSMISSPRICWSIYCGLNI